MNASRDHNLVEALHQANDDGRRAVCPCFEAVDFESEAECLKTTTPSTATLECQLEADEVISDFGCAPFPEPFQAEYVGCERL